MSRMREEMGCSGLALAGVLTPHSGTCQAQPSKGIVASLGGRYCDGPILQTGNRLRVVRVPCARSLR